MCLRFHRALALLALAIPAWGAERVLRVCVDPNNLPFSSYIQPGLENRLAEIVAEDLGAKLELVWWSERKSFLKSSLYENRCDAVMGVPAGIASVLTTRPYYRSTYVFVSRADRHLEISSLADERLAAWKIGMHVVGDDYAPPAQVLARRGIVANVVAYSLFGKYGEPNPAANIIDAVARGDVDVAIVWGPFAGYFAQRRLAALTIAPVLPSMYLAVPFTYGISVAVRSKDGTLRDEIDRVLTQHCEEIQALLTEYGVPRAPEGNPSCDLQPSSASASSH